MYIFQWPEQHIEISFCMSCDFFSADDQSNSIEIEINFLS